MNTIKILVGWFEEHFPNVYFTLTPPTENEDTWFLDIYCNEKYIVVCALEANAEFYVYAVSNDLRVEFEQSFETENDAFKYIIELIGKIKCIK